MIKKVKKKLAQLRFKIRHSDKTKSVKIIAYTVVFILVCTFLSRAASAVLTPRIVTGRVTTDKIQHQIYTSAIIEAVKKNPVYIKSSLLIDEVLVNIGDNVTSENPIARYNMDMLESTLEDYNFQMKLYTNERKDTWDKTEIDNKIDKLNSEIDDITKLINAKGYVYSDETGTVLAVNAEAGQYSTDTAAFILADPAEGFEVKTSVSMEQVDYVNQGDIAKVFIGEDSESCEVKSVTPDETNSEMYDVVCPLTGESYVSGMQVSIYFTHTSEKTGFCIPIEAVRGDSTGSYVLVIDYKSGILGEEMVASKIRVDMVDSNDQYAVVSSSSLSTDYELIVSSDKNIEAGDTVREED